MRSSRSTVFVLVISVLVGATLVANEPGGQSNPLWALWAPLALALCLAEGLVFVYGVRRWDELCALQPIRFGDVALPTAAAAAASLAVINLTVLYPGPEGVNWQNAVLLSMAVLTGIPVGAVMLGVDRAAAHTTGSRTPGGQVALLMGLRKLHQRLLAAVGAVVTLTTLQAGALLKLEHSLGTDFGSRAPEYVLVFGGVGSLIVGTIYAPGWTAITEQARDLSERLFPLKNVRKPADILAAVESRQKLDLALGTERGMVADLQAGVLILGPLIAAATVFFLH